jgi:hypothetical protein
VTPQQAATLGAIGNDRSAAPTFGDLGAWVAWNAHTLAGEAVCDMGEWAMKRKAARTRAPKVRKPVRRRADAALVWAGFVARMVQR